jgi:hypothetical protein
VPVGQGSPRGPRPEVRWWTDERVDLLAHLRCVEGMSWNEVAATLGCTCGAAKNQYKNYNMVLTPQARAIRRGRDTR